MWAKDPSPWKQPIKGQREIIKRLGWLTVADTMLGRVDELTSLAEEIRSEGIQSVVVLGMGGSSLSPEVSYEVFGSAEGFPKLFVLDSTVPAAIRTIEQQIDLESTLFIVSSKSGETIETKCAYKYFFAKSSPERFIAITDPGSWLAGEAEAKGFRRAFLNMPDIGGRYSALSYFGLVPAALIGVDVAGLLESARNMKEACGPAHPARNNPGVALGAIMAELALRGRDKMTMVFSPQLESFGAWVEQIVAESTGKEGRGILPVEIETPCGPKSHGEDRFLVYTRLKGDEDSVSHALALMFQIAGQPVVTIEIDRPIDLGGEYFRWEIATAAASAFLAVNAFDQPDVAAAKKKTQEFLDEHKARGEFRRLTKLAEDEDLILYADPETKATLDLFHANGAEARATPESMLRAHLQRTEPGNYLALMAFIERTDELDALLQAFRLLLRDICNVPTTLGYGPRFLHSTGQFHKGGPNSGLFIQITAGDPADVDIPGEDYSFAVLKDAQALGDLTALREKGRRIIRIHLGNDIHPGLKALLGILRRLRP
jgi:glucose-6-phosphate isomerase